MIHEHPLAYLLGLEGIALLRSFTGEHDRAFVDARLAEVRRLLADRALADGAVEVARLDTREGYEVWSSTYDGPNPAFDYDGAMIDDVAGGLPPGVALDAACGTGRVAARLATHGHRVIGVDSSPAMLVRARANLPGVDFRAGDLHRLPVDDASVDIVTCSLALTHVRDLGRCWPSSPGCCARVGTSCCATCIPSRSRSAWSRPCGAPTARRGG